MSTNYVSNRPSGDGKGEYKYVPISIAVPAFATVEAIAAPIAIPGDVWGVINSTNYFTIRQHLKLLPKNCCSCPPCVSQENTYSVYAGKTQDSQSEFLRIDEVSDDWNRCCCKPFHPVRLEVRPYLPFPGDGTSSDYGHIQADTAASWSTLTGRDQAIRMKEIYKQYPPILSFQRYDGQRCCCKMPCRWFHACVFCGFCQDGFDVYAGALEDEPDKEVGRPYNLPAHQSQMLGSVTQPICGGYYHPQLDLREGNTIQAQGQDQSVPFAKLEGPCFFGGWSELCCDFKFPLSSYNSPASTGDLGAVIKKKPQSGAGVLRSLLGDNSVYEIQFAPDTKLNASQKSIVLASQLLYDYMLFDGSTEKCHDDENAVYCYFCYCMLFGALIPCELVIPKKKG